ncbi:MAG: hypothetical protein LAN64_13200 [Acidobacteriia bacterium]|nr:hypothetical protein [Terriglobia bacterium]
MKSVVRVAIAGMMLLGLLSVAAMPKNPKNNVVMVAGGGPAPACDPNADPRCLPPIPPSR